MRRLLPLFLLLGLLGLLVGARWPQGTAAAPEQIACSSGYVDAVIGGQSKCLRAGEFCSSSYEADYERYGFACVDGHLQSKGSSPTTTSTSSPTTTSAPVTSTVATTTSTAATTTSRTAPATTTTSPTWTTSLPITLIGRTVLLAPRTRTSNCTLGPLPDRRCSPGAYYSGLTKTVICSPSFRTSTIRNVPESEKHAVEVEYGLAPKPYGRTLEIDHIVSLELGGSNDIANLFPEKASFPGHQPGFQAKDRLENAVHDAVCGGQFSLRAAQQQIALNWQALYKRLLGVAPSG